MSWDVTIDFCVLFTVPVAVVLLNFCLYVVGSAYLCCYHTLLLLCVGWLDTTTLCLPIWK